MSHHFLTTNAPLSTLLFVVVSMVPLPLRLAQYTATHTFSIDDVIGDFNGTTYAEDRSILCVPNPDNDCADATIVEDGTTLYPIDSEFGFLVADFLGAVTKPRDNDYMEGYAGNIMDGQDVVGLKISNAATDTYKTPARFGAWCSGMGGTSVKCSSEHFTVMEHILSCHEAVPYLNADPITGEQKVVELTGLDDKTYCADKQLDYTAFVIKDGNVSSVELNYTNPFDTPLEPNDNTDVLNNIALTNDFSVTLKDDGKLLYRWGNLIKRPNDIRLRAQIALPDEWKNASANFSINSAYLVIDHLITNNPNDQLRAEDLENEGATGRKPSYKVDETRWVSTKDCYEGDGDFLDATIDASEIGIGTVLKNTNFSQEGMEGPVGNVPYTSADLVGGFTNAFYTTLDRDPFEWSYKVNNSDTTVNEFRGYLTPLTQEEEDILDLTLVSGPRWRLRANKFGQDIPGLEIPKQECSKPPFKNDNIKYEVGERVETWINLLDWESDPSPLAYSTGWVDYKANFGIEDKTVKEVHGKNVSQNGLELTDDFDLAVYIKGDKKPTDIYSATIIIDYEGGPPAGIYNLIMTIHNVTEKRIIFGDSVTVFYEIFNDGPARSPANGVRYTLSYSDNKSDQDSWPESVNEKLDAIEGGDSTGPLSWTFTAPTSQSTINAKVVAQLFQKYDDSNPDDDKDTIDFQIKKN